MFVKIYTIFIVFVEYVIIIWNIISIPIIKDMFFFTGYFAFISNQMKTWLEEFVSLALYKFLLVTRNEKHFAFFEDQS